MQRDPSIPDHPPATRNLSPECARALVQQLLDTPNGNFSAKTILEEHPALRDYHSCVVDLAYEDYCRRRDQGHSGSVTEFVNGFEMVQQSLYRIIEFDRFLHDHPSMIEDVPESSWPTVGDVYLDRFNLLEALGRGAMSRVFLAQQIDVGSRPVVVKVCFRGEREADLLGKLEHPAIAPVYGIDPDETCALSAICMPFLTRTTLHVLSEMIRFRHPGEDLTCDDLRRLVADGNRGTLLPRNPRGESTAAEFDTGPAILPEDAKFSTVLLHWGATLADALHFAHGRNVLHCDVKPANILVMPDLSVSLLDFNLASSQEESGIGLIGGTLPYMASEQLLRVLPVPDEGTRPACTSATDVFGLCASLWHMATGEPPFGNAPEAETQSSAANLLLERQLPGISDEQIAAARARLPEAVVQLLCSGMRFDPQQRPEMHELATRFRALLPKPRFRRSWRQIGLAVLLICGVAGIAAAAAYNVVPEAQRVPLDDQAAALFSAGDFDAARPLYVDLVARDPQDAAAAARLAECEIRLRQWADAIQVCSPFASADPHCDFLYNLATTCSAPEFCDDIRVPAVRPNVGNASSTTQDLALIRETWQNLYDVWIEASRKSHFREYSLLNLAWIQFHMSLAAESRTTVEQIQHLPVGDSRFAVSLKRLRDNLQIAAQLNQAKMPTPEQMTLLRKRTQAAGSLRGEVLLLLDAFRTVADGADPGVSDDARAAAIDEYVVVLEKHVGFDIHPNDAMSVYESRFFSTTDHRHKILSLLQTAARPTTTHLSSVLVMPPAEW